MTFYVVMDDEGFVLDNYGDFTNVLVRAALYDEPSEPTNSAKRHGGHVVTLIEEPEKVVLTEEQAEIVEEAHKAKWPATYISGLDDGSEEILLINAFVNGYTVEKEKKYNVKVPLVQAQGGLWFYINSDDKLDATYIQGLAKKFTKDEIEENGLQDCEKEEVTDDDD